ncbi:polyisoprenoid-binding protein [Iodidimonas nitroreducens]|uniref:Polyisoprenoid-binding protein n=1 Tax=Iodidimonas nitroreducens TaxID=1236968 RepID=A0A5A7N5R5_9PROT|nr:YceI family protein [Iodidimonas nitroreducens]GAK33638.1 protein YceI [alpha proteobacterium Q-1]GER03662.1 polyisoprenoid-binding protein [Iodidimonas nitroreducens]
MTRMKTLMMAAGAALLMTGASASVQAAPETFEFDEAHTHIGLAWNHLGFSETRARFADFEGALILDQDNPANSSLSVTIPISSLDTGLKKFDDHLKSADFFDAATYPEATFKSTKIELDGDKAAKVHGDLTIHGVTKPVVLDVTLNQLGKHPMNGKTHAGFTATTKIKRSDFGINQYVPMVSDDVEIFISTEASKAE